MASAGRTYGGKSSDDRRAERRERLLAAGLELLGDEGLAAFTVRGVCARAGLTPRYFYEEFGTADELARQLFDREFDLALQRVGIAVAGAGEDTLVRVDAAVGAVLDVMTEVPARAAVLLTEASGAGVLAARRAERMEDVIGVVAGFGRATYASGDPRTDAAAVDEGDRALRVAATFVAGGLAQTIDAWLRGRAPGSRDALQRDLAAEIVAVGDAAFARLRAWPEG
ncbi:MAG: TetR family transcriptional regulator [Solirubrobacteraceae bacterium]|nr:TetR family transcriptional regulator [Solirubrobacteraceae bacterium]